MCGAEPGRESARLRAAVNPRFLRRPRESLNNAFREPLAAAFEIRRQKVVLAEAHDDFGREFSP
jgi:hypothetical protein